MMKRLSELVISCFVVGALYVPCAVNASIVLQDWRFNVNGTIYQTLGSLPSSFDLSAFDVNTGIGTFTWTASSPGSHSMTVLLDHWVDQPSSVDPSDSDTDEYGNVVGVLPPVAGQSWEIDDVDSGDILNNFANAALDNTNGVASPQTGDVALAMGWNLTLAAGEQAIVSFVVTPSVDHIAFLDFTLQHTDVDAITTPFPCPVGQICATAREGVSFYGNVSINTFGVPEPTTLVLLGLGLAGIAFRQQKSGQPG